MGVDLRLLPLDHLSYQSAGSIWGFSHTVLSLPRDSDAWPAFEAMRTEQVPAGANISSFCGKRVPDGASQGELMYGIIRDKDAYGSPYTWTTAGELKPVLAKWFATCPSTAYINALSDDTKVILDWH